MHFFNDIFTSTGHPHTEEAWYTSGYVLDRTTYLKVPTFTAHVISMSPVYQILDTAPIESLDVETETGDRLSFDFTRGIEGHPLHRLQSLHRLSIRKLWVNIESFQKSLQASQSRLTHVTIADYSVIRPSHI